MAGFPAPMQRFANDPPIEQRLGEALSDTGATLSLVEGCTGGLAASLVTNVPGASDYLRRAVVPYSYDSLRLVTGVPREMLDEHGAVSRPVATELARRARDMADATWGVAITGIAGPGGGSASKPVGTGYIGIANAAPWGSGRSSASASRHTFDGDRAAIRERLARAALAAIHERLSSTDQ